MADDLALYRELVEQCNASGFRVHLDFGLDGWTLDVFEDGKLIARGTSPLKNPRAAHRECAADAAIGLGRSGRAKRRRR